MFLNPHKNLSKISLSESHSVAEFGSGAGHYTFLISQMVGPSGKVYAIDLSQGLLQRISNEAKENSLSNIHIIWADLEKQKASALKDESVDLVVITNTLFQIGRKDRVAEEAKRILKKKGRLFLVEWEEVSTGVGPHKKHLVRKEDAVSLFGREGLVLDREVDSGDHHYGLLFRKS